MLGYCCVESKETLKHMSEYFYIALLLLKEVIIYFWENLYSIFTTRHQTMHNDDTSFTLPLLPVLIFCFFSHFFWGTWLSFIPRPCHDLKDC